MVRAYPTIEERYGMSQRLALVFAALVLTASATACRGSGDKTTSTPATSVEVSGPTAHAYLSGGCFWCVEKAFEGVPGIKAVISGYTGGKEKNPTYEQVSSGQTGHYEAVDVVYDPTRISYEKVLDIFWRNIDPMQQDGQFCDLGSQYRSAIFHRDSTEERIARNSKRALEASGKMKQPLATAILPAGPFWPAEDYHQDFWKKNPVRYQAYSMACRRDQRLDQIWGKEARPGTKP
jgi:peptide-methionine (S)-S-oxide reductase